MSTSSRPELIGFAGTFASGKDLIAHYLSTHYGYMHVSTSEIVRNIAMRERGSVERPVLQEVATTHRKQDGADVFVQMALQTPRPTVVTGLRSLGEMNAIKAAGGVVAFIDAPAELRYERMIARDRDDEVHLSFEEFQAGEAKEWRAGESDADFNLEGIKAAADFVFDSSPGREEFLHDALKKLAIL